VIVVADAHLGQVPAAVADRFHRFLDQVPRPGDALLVNGDLFDFWFEWGDVVPEKHRATVEKLSLLVRRGIPVTLMGGNHDRWGGPFLSNRGITFHAQPAELTLAGRRAWVAHGDGLTEQHWTGALTHHLLKHKATIAVFRALPPGLGFRIADWLSGTLADSTKDRAVLDRAAAAQRAYATALLAGRPDLSLVILAHTHRPALERLSGGRTYLNPGAWLDGGRYAVIERERVELKTFETG